MARKPKAEALDPASWPATQNETWSVDDLVPYARNSRKHTVEQIDLIARSIKRWGWTQRVLVAEDGTIIAGHARVMAAQKLGVESVPVMVARGWSEEQIRAYVIADNALGDMSSFDDDLLRLEVGELRDGDFDVAALGLDQKTLDGLFATPTEPEAPSEFKAFGEDIETEHVCPKCSYRWSGKAS